MIQRIDTSPQLPDRPTDGHKGLFGRVLIVGGSENMLGAPVLAGLSALRMGSGLVQIAVPRSILAACLSIAPELIGLGVTDSPGAALNAAVESADAIAIGPGLGTSPRAKRLVTRLIAAKGKPLVIDADALNILAAAKRWPRAFAASAVLTPHPGEMKRLAKLMDRDEVPDDDDGRINLAVAASQAFEQIIVLKGHHTIVTDGRRVYVNATGDSSLSKAGTGDVLTGMIASLIGQKMDRFDAACAGVHLHGRAGEIAGERLGRRCVIARDVIDALPAAVAQVTNR